MRKNQQEKEVMYSDRIIDFITTKGPSQDFWFFTLIISFTVWLTWHVLKWLGYINTPWWIQMIPTLTTVLVVLSSILVFVGKVMRKVGNWETNFEYMRKDIEVLKKDTKEMNNRLIVVEHTLSNHLQKAH